MSSRRADANGLVIGGEPRIDFLPPEIKAGKKARSARRSLVGLVIIVIVVCAAGYVFATTIAIQAELRLGEEQTRTQQLLSEQAKYSEVRTVSAELASVKNAVRAGSATEILWRDYLAALQAKLPAGTVIDTFAVDSQTALESAPVSSVPLEGARVATITFTALMPSLATGDALLVNLRGLPGFADATATAISNEAGLYRASIVLNVNAEAFEMRFFDGYDKKSPTSTTPVEAQKPEVESSSDDAPADTTTEGEE